MVEITSEQAVKICREWSEAIDVTSVTNELIARGFRAYCPYSKWLESFCNPEDLKIHRAIKLERPKVILATPFPFNLDPAQAKNLYSSSLFASLKSIRDDESGSRGSGVSGMDRDPVEGEWRKEIDPCLRAMSRARAVDFPVFSASRLEVVDEMRLILEEEGRQNFESSAGQYFLDEKSRVKFVTNLIKSFRGKAGKPWRRAVGSRCFLEFVSEIDQEWELSLHIIDKRDFLLTPLKGYFVLELRVQKKSVDQKQKILGQYLIFNYSGLVPGFSIAYWEFFSIDQLRAIVLAHLTLIDVLLKIIKKPIASKPPLGSARPSS
jgi:hypothetical protein